jgi:hypothetical protein
MTRRLRIPTLALVAAGLALPAHADRLFLSRDGTQPAPPVQAAVLEPFDVFLVAQRDSGKTQISAVVYTLEVPDGMVVAGEEMLASSLLAIGNSRQGVNLVFRCVDGPQVRVLRFRLVATRRLDNAVVRLRPDTRTRDLGLVTCKEEAFQVRPVPPESLMVTAR